MSMSNRTSATTQVYRIYIKATPQAIWDAITKPEWSARYGYGGRGEFELKPGGSYRAYTSEEMRKAGAEQGIDVPELAIEGEVIEVDEPHKLVLSWHMVMDDNTASDAFTRLIYEIEAIEGGATKLTLIHDLEGAPIAAAILSGEWEADGAGGGWSWVLSDLKSLLETGASLRG